MKIALIALDLDGTLLTRAKEISEANREALRALAAKGVRIAIASGRMPSCIVPYEEKLGIDCYLMAYNGAACFSPKAEGRKRLYHQPLPAGFAGGPIDLCTERHLFLNVYLDEKVYGIDAPDLRRYAELYSAHTGAVYEFVPDYEPFRNTQPSKLLIVAEPARRNTLYDEFHPRFEPEVHVVKSDPEFLEFLHPRADKGSAFRALCGALRVPIEETVAFGDAENDIELLSAAGYGICMANGEARTKAAADLISEFTNNQDGVARELERLVD